MIEWIFLALGFQELADQHESPSWPAIRDYELSVGFSGSAERFELYAPIYGLDGAERYWLICVGGSDEYLDRRSTEDGSNYVGPLSCRLDTEYRVGGYSLLGPSDLPVWHTRGQFHTEELIGECGEYPDYGRTRSFRLRGLELTLSISEMELTEDNKTKFFMLGVSVKNDTSAQSSRAELSKYVDPATAGATCDSVRLRE